jgi:hypothetical protein
MTAKQSARSSAFTVVREVGPRSARAADDQHGNGVADVEALLHREGG